MKKKHSAEIIKAILFVNIVRIQGDSLFKSVMFVQKGLFRNFSWTKPRLHGCAKDFTTLKEENRHKLSRNLIGFIESYFNWPSEVT